MNDLALRLPAADAQRVLLVHALEEFDRGASVLDLDLRRTATREALAGRAADEPARWLAVRARVLVAHLAAAGSPQRTRVLRLLRLSDPLTGVVVPLMLVALALGALSNVLGPQQRVNLLAPPLLALILWNLAMFTALSVRSVASFWWPPSGPSRWLRWLEQWLSRRLPDDGWVQSFLARWLPACRHLAAARLAHTLHLAALAMAAGVVGGMYLRGLVLAYQASWQSTFLGAGQVGGLLKLVLAPAAALLRVDVPQVAALEAPASGSAAPWIHLWAVTALLFVGLPRLILAALEWTKAWHVGRRLEIVLPAVYAKRLRASASAATPEVQILPFSYRPVERAVQSLRELLQDLTGARARIRLAPSIDYGAGPVDAFAGTLRVVVFNLAQTPEVEVHARLVHGLRADLPDGQGLLVLVDESPLRRKLAEIEPLTLAERLESRRRAWRRVMASEEQTPVSVDLERPMGDDPETSARDHLLAAMERALWPTGSASAGHGPAGGE